MKHKPLARCAKGCDAPPKPPSLVICGKCMDKITRKLEAMVADSKRKTMPNPPHLWEVEHPYYAAEGNYFDGNCHQEYRGWLSFLAAEGDADIDMNLVYRWDWDKDGATLGTLKLFFIGQRKAIARSVAVTVTDEEEPAVRAWLEPRLRRLMELWAPMEVPPAEPGPMATEPREDCSSP